MELGLELIKYIAPIVGFLALWWKMTTTVATKSDIAELNAKIDRL